MPVTDSHVGGVFVIDVGAIVLGIVLMLVLWATRPAYFRGEILNRDTPTRVPEDLGVPVGLFGIDESTAPAAAVATPAQGAPVEKEPDAR